jgi:large subunit ribosomal protein L18
MIKQFHANKARLQRHQRMRKYMAGTAHRPRLSVFRSSTHIYAQIIDDETGRTIVAASSREALPSLALPPTAANRSAGEAEIAESAIKGIENNRKVALARLTGHKLAERAHEQGITHVIFDRGGYRYHGRVAALALGAREGGLEF